MSSHLLQGRPTEQESFLTNVGEMHRRLCLVAYPFDVEDHAFTPLRVQDVVADPQTERLCAAR